MTNTTDPEETPIPETEPTAPPPGFFIVGRSLIGGPDVLPPLGAAPEAAEEPA